LIKIPLIRMPLIKMPLVRMPLIKMPSVRMPLIKMPSIRMPLIKIPLVDLTSNDFKSVSFALVQAMLEHLAMEKLFLIDGHLTKCCYNNH
jgi:hypothetical protein